MVIIQVNISHNTCDLTVKQIHAVFYIESSYDYHFITKEVAKKFKGQFESLDENTEKYKTFSVPIKITKYKARFIYHVRFTSNSLHVMSKISVIKINVKTVNAVFKMKKINTKHYNLIVQTAMKIT